MHFLRVCDFGRCSFGLLVQRSSYLVSLVVCLWSALSHTNTNTHSHTRRLLFRFLFVYDEAKCVIRCDAILCNALLYCLCAEENRWMDGGAGWSQLPVPMVAEALWRSTRRKSIVCTTSCRWIVLCQRHGKRFRSLDLDFVEWTTLSSEWWDIFVVSLVREVSNRYLSEIICIFMWVQMLVETDWSKETFFCIFISHFSFEIKERYLLTNFVFVFRYSKKKEANW